MVPAVLIPLNRWSNFYSGAIAWRMSDEAFIKNLNFFDNLKLRFSAGQTGNQGISAYATRSRFEAQNYPFDGTMNPGAGEDRWGGPAAANFEVGDNESVYPWFGGSFLQ